jgi:hypothetical protein
MMVTACWGGGMLAQTPPPAESAREEGGKWNLPPAELPAWTHAATALRFPVVFNDYVMQGVMDFAAAPGDHLVRYLNAEMQARGDIFVQKLDAASAPKDKESKLKVINQTLNQAVGDLMGMAEAGRYDELIDDGPLEGRIEVWKADPLPLRAQQLSAIRIEKQADKEIRVPLKIWYGCTVFAGHVILMRHMRPAEKGEKGVADMKSFVESMTRILKDPSLRQEVRPAMELYVQKPLTKEGQEAAKIVLGYLENSPMVPVLVPQPPLTTWAAEMEKIVPNSGSQMLRAYVISGALAALNDKDSRRCLTLACQQVVRVYLEIKRLKPTVWHEGLEDMTKAVERGEVATWFEKQLAEAAAKAAK